LAVKEFAALGVAHDRITAEEQSRNTIENAVFSRLLADPKPGERLLLVTSASHMPRAIAAFRAAGFPVEAYPVNWHTRGRRDAAELFPSFAGGLAMTDYAMHEWIGLAAYWLTGKTSELFPAPWERIIRLYAGPVYSQPASRRRRAFGASPCLYQSFIAAAEYSGLLSFGRVR